MTRRPESSPRQFLAVTLVLLCNVALWSRVDTYYVVPPVFVPATALLSLVLLYRYLPVHLLLFWLSGLLSLAWSLGPGNTVVAFLWESLLPVSFGVGMIPLACLATLAIFVIDGYQYVVALAQLGPTIYLSGSIGYVTGAMGAAFASIALSYATGVSTRMLVRVLAVLASSLGTAVALGSGSRAVYLGLVLGCTLVLLKRPRMGYLRSVPIVLVAVVVLTVGIDQLTGGVLVSQASGVKGTVAQTTATLESYGVLTQRLRLWHQGLNAALEYPFGTGAGTYPATTHAFQIYPMLWSSSPHNYLVEVLATGGWLRLGLLLILLTSSVKWGFRGAGWPFTVAGLVLATTTLFDVTGGYPRVMTMVWMLFGAGYYQGRREHTDGSRLDVEPRWWSRMVRVGSLVVLAAVIGWWYWPCEGAMCSTNRYLGLDRKALPALEAATDSERPVLLDRLKRLYPRSLWVDQIALAYTTDPEARLAGLRTIAQTYPYQNPDNYLRWAKAALELGETQQAIQALRTGLVFFPRSQYPYGEMRMTPEMYQTWADEAEALLASLTTDRGSSQ